MQPLSVSSMRKQIMNPIRIAAVLLLSGVCGTVSAQRTNVFSKEPALAQKVRFQVEGMSVAELLKRLSAKTGVSLSAEREAAEDKLIVYSPLRPLSETLAEVAELFGDVWQVRQDNPKTPEQKRWVLVRTTRTRELERGRREAQIQGLIAQIEAAKSARRSDQKAPKEQSLLACLSSGSTETLVRQGWAQVSLAQLGEDERHTLASLRPRLNRLLAFSAAPPSFPAFGKAASGRGRVLNRAVGSPSLPFLPPKPEAETSLPRDSQPTLEDESLVQNGLFFVLMPPNRGGEERVEIHGFREVLLKTQSLLAPPHGNPYTNPKDGPPSNNLPSLEEIGMARQDDWKAGLKAFAEKSGRPVLCDYYRTSSVPPLPAAAPDRSSVPAPALELDAVFAQSRTERTWWIHGKTLLLRHRNWTEQARYEIPDEWLDRVTAQIAAHGGKPQLRDFALRGELTPDQRFALDMDFAPVLMAVHDSLKGWIGLRLAQIALEGLSRLNTAKWNPKSPLPLFKPTAEDQEQKTLSFDLFPARTREAMLFPFLRVLDPNLEKNGFNFILEPEVNGPATQRWLVTSSPLARSERAHSDTPLIYVTVGLPRLTPDDHRAEAQIELEAESAETPQKRAAPH